MRISIQGAGTVAAAIRADKVMRVRARSGLLTVGVLSGIGVIGSFIVL